MERFAGQVVLVTGGASGLGLATAARFSREGASVAIVDVDEIALKEAAETLRQTGATVQTVVGDVSQATDVERAVATTAAELGPIDVLVNNAGVFKLEPYVKITDDEFHRQVTINLYGTHLFMSRVLPSMIERGRGAIVNISSAAATHYTVPHAAYAASKAGVIALTRDVGFEVARHGVRVNGIAPGLIATDKTVAQLEATDESLSKPTAFRPMGWGRPDDIAGAVAFLASDDARFIVGVTIPVAGGTDLMVSMAANDVAAMLGE